MYRNSFICILLTLAGTACASSQGEKVRDARMEQADARDERRSDAIEGQSEVRKETIQREHIAVPDNVAAANPTAQAANEDLGKVSEDRALYQSKATARLDKLGVRIDTTQEKLNALGSKAPSGLQGDLQTAVQEHKMLKREIANLRQTPPSNWEATTRHLEQRMESLDERLSKLNGSISDV